MQVKIFTSKGEKSKNCRSLVWFSIFSSWNEENRHVSTKIDEKNRKLLLAQITRFMQVCKLLFFDLLMLPTSPSQPVPRLTSRQSWCISSDSVVHPIGKGEDGAWRICTKTYYFTFFPRNAQMEWASKVFFVQLNL